MVVEIKIPAEAAKDRLLERNQSETPTGETNQKRSIDRPGMSGQYSNQRDRRTLVRRNE